MYRFCWRCEIGMEFHGLFVWTLEQVEAQIAAWKRDTPEWKYWYEKETE